MLERIYQQDEIWGEKGVLGFISDWVFKRLCSESVVGMERKGMIWGKLENVASGDLGKTGLRADGEGGEALGWPEGSCLAELPGRSAWCTFILFPYRSC